MKLLDISVSGAKTAKLKAKSRPKVDRAANERAMRSTRDEIAAKRVYDDEEEARLTLPDSAVMPHHANDNVAADNVADGNDSASKARTIEPFHRLWKQGGFTKRKL